MAKGNFKKFDPDRYFAEVVGSPEIKFLQRSTYYDAHYKAVSKQPVDAISDTERKIKETISKKEQPKPEVKPLSTKDFTVPDAIAEAQKENRQAAEAENKAIG